MRVYIDGFCDELFCCLWVAKSDIGGNIKKDLKITQKKGITKKEVCVEIMLQYKKFKIFELDLSYHLRLERFFDINYTIITKMTKTSIILSFCSQSWYNMHFITLNSRGQYGYIKLKSLDIFPILSKNNSMINLPLEEVCKLYGKEPLLLPLNADTWEQWSKHMQRNIIVYNLKKDGKIYIPGNQVSPCVFDFDDIEPISFVINNKKLFESGGGSYKLLANDKIIVRQFKCPTKNCYFKNFRKDVVNRHIKSCAGDKDIKTKSITYGNPESMLERGVRLGYLPASAVKFRQQYLVTFDIECLETDYDGDKVGMAANIEKYQKIVSLAVGSNLPNTQPQFFCRSSSDPSTEQILIDQFLDHLDDLHTKYQEQLPTFIQDAIDQIEDDLDKTSFSHLKCEMQSVLGHLRKYDKLRVYAFNGGMLLNISQLLNTV